MAIMRYTASADNTITNAFEENLTTRGTGSNMGASDILETFMIYGQATSSSVELSRILVQFPTSAISADRTASKIAASGSVTWKLKLYNAVHSQPVPRSFDLQVSAVSASWQEGTGLDMDGYSDLTNDNTGSNWINASSNFTSASFTMSLQGGANKAAMSGQSFTLTDSDGTSQTFTFNIANNTVSSGSIGMQIDSNTTDIINTIKSAINDASLSSLDIEASTITAVGDADSEMRLLIKQKTTGNAGNTSVDLSGVAHLSVLNSESGFTGGSGKWANAGGDYNSTIVKTQSFDTGLEDLEIDVSDIVEKWLLNSNPWPNYGFGIRLTDAYESGSTSYYTKKFFARNTEFFYKQPVLEAQFNDQKTDDRGNFQISSSVLPAAYNLNKLYFYNNVRGRFVDIAGDSSKRPVLKLYYSSGSVPEGSARGFLNSSNSAVTSLTATRESEGVYYAQIAATASIVNTTYPYLIDVWEYSGAEVLTGSAITPKEFNPRLSRSETNYVLSMTNLRNEYRQIENARLRLYAREKNWSPNIYTVAKTKPQNKIIISGSYRVLRIVDDLDVVPYGTGSLAHTGLSYDVSGNYFDLNMEHFETGYQYGIKFSIYDDYSESYVEQPYIFKFRVIK